MNLYEFKQHKKNLALYMKQQLGISRYIGEILQPYVVVARYETVNIFKTDTVAEVKGKTLELDAILSIPNVKLTTLPITERVYCREEYLGTKYDVAIPEFRQAISEEQVQTEMKKFIKLKLGVESWDTLNCQVLDLFKRGKLNWAEVEEAHNVDCSL